MLLTDLPPHGRKGEIILVKYGFAHNFLFKKQLATIATPNIVKLQYQEDARHEQKLKALKIQTQQYQQMINQTQLFFKIPTGPTGQVQKVITAKQISAQLSLKLNISRSAFWLTRFKPLQMAGSYKVPIKLKFQLMAHLKVVVNP